MRDAHLLTPAIGQLLRTVAPRGAFGVWMPGAAGEAMQRQSCLASAQVPKSSIDRGEGDRGQRSDGRGMYAVEQAAPDCFDFVGVATN